ncbi:effector-associated constant component EACC1 [Dactylosporangium matsuzakiense]|uniref:effector-associated constant component EACC1 n=1 Tax=Dactylosporangium matsuzakiense TaxID=53360 RepID=UPI0021C4789F|nr:hypothetical protein [Dactylosporangium matsuzakiense]UWZ44643.1 hypothetical protein Dmats_46140 [Dactylosporangium matsuzakiense]
MIDHADDILVLAYLIAAPDDDRNDVELGVVQVNRALASLGTLRPVPTAPAPDGTRGIDISAVGAVCAQILPAVPDLLAVLRSLLTWTRQRPGRTAKVVRADGSSIEVTGLSEQDQHLLVEDWLRQPSA